jgi:hypothetical protein
MKPPVLSPAAFDRASAASAANAPAPARRRGRSDPRCGCTCLPACRSGRWAGARQWRTWKRPVADAGLAPAGTRGMAGKARNCNRALRCGRPEWAGNHTARPCASVCSPLAVRSEGWGMKFAIARWCAPVVMLMLAGPPAWAQDGSDLPLPHRGRGLRGGRSARGRAQAHRSHRFARGEDARADTAVRPRERERAHPECRSDDRQGPAPARPRRVRVCLAPRRCRHEEAAHRALELRLGAVPGVAKCAARSRSG